MTLGKLVGIKIAVKVSRKLTLYSGTLNHMITLEIHCLATEGSGASPCQSHSHKNEAGLQ